MDRGFGRTAPCGDWRTLGAFQFFNGMIRVGGGMLLVAALAAGCGSRSEADSEASTHRTTPAAVDGSVPASGPDDGGPQAAGNDAARSDGSGEFDGGALREAGTEGGAKYKLNPDAGPIEQCGTLGAAAVAFSASSSGLLAVGHADGLVTLRNESLVTTREIQADTIVAQLALSSDGKKLATVGADPEIRLWSANDGSRIGTLAWPRSAPYDTGVALSFSQDSLFLLATALGAPNVDQHRNTTLFDLAAGKIAWTRTDDWYSLAFLVDAGAAVLVATNGDVKVYGRVDGQVLRSASAPALASTLGVVPSPNGSLVATGGAVVSTSDFQTVHQLGGGSPVFSADGSALALTQLVGMSFPSSSPP